MHGHRRILFVLAVPSRDKKTIHTSLIELLWVPGLWDKGLTPPPSTHTSCMLKTPLRSRPSLRLQLPLCSHISLFRFSDPALGLCPGHPYCLEAPAV